MRPAGLCPDRESARNDRHFVAIASFDPVNRALSGGIGIVLKGINAQQSRQLRGNDLAGRASFSAVPIHEIKSENPYARKFHVLAEALSMKLQRARRAARLAVLIGIKITAA